MEDFRRCGRGGAAVVVVVGVSVLAVQNVRQGEHTQSPTRCRRDLHIIEVGVARVVVEGGQGGCEGRSGVKRLGLAVYILRSFLS